MKIYQTKPDVKLGMYESTNLLLFRNDGTQAINLLLVVCWLTLTMPNFLNRIIHLKILELSIIILGLSR